MTPQEPSASTRSRSKSAAPVAGGAPQAREGHDRTGQQRSAVRTFLGATPLLLIVFPVIVVVLVVAQLATGVLTAWVVAAGVEVLPGGSGPVPAVTQLDVIKVGLALVAIVVGVLVLIATARRQDRGAGGTSDTQAAYAQAAAQLGDESPTVRLAGVHALAALADHEADLRQQCVDVLCGHLQLPWNLPTGSRSAETQPAAGEEQVRTAIVRVIARHLLPDGVRPQAVPSWSALPLDFRGATLPEADFEGVRFDGPVRFDGVTFRGAASFAGAAFSHDVSFAGATFAEVASFEGTTFSTPAVWDGVRFDQEPVARPDSANAPGQRTPQPR